MKRSRGSGAIITRPHTSNLYIRFWRNGKQVQEAVGSSSYAEAEKLLRTRLVDNDRGALPAQDIKRLRYEDIRASYLTLRPEQAKYPGLQFIDAFFKGKRVDRITTQTIEDFIEHRREDDEVSEPTIRRNLVCLRAMFHLARKKGQLGLRDVPYFPMPRDSEPAGTYITPEDFAKIHSHLPAHLRPFYTFLYGTACRLGAARRITWAMVTNKECDRVEIPGELIKSRTPQTTILDGATLAPLAAWLRNELKTEHARLTRSRFKYSDKLGAVPVDRDSSGALRAKTIFNSANYRKAWAQAVAKAGLGTWDPKTRTRTGPRIHDCRCSAAINLLDAGVDESSVLKIGGWKTRHMLDRYNVQTEKRIRAAMIKAGEHVAAKMKNGATA